MAFKEQVTLRSNMEVDNSVLEQLNTFTYLLTYLLHGEGHYLKSLYSSAPQKMSCFRMEPEGSLSCSQKPAIGPYPEPYVHIFWA